jgi:hypothetical protein
LPDAKLDIEKAAAGTTFVPYLQLSQTYTVASSKYGILFKNTEYGWDQARISVERQSSASNFDLVLSSANSGNLVEGMRIDHLGDVLVSSGGLTVGATSQVAGTQVAIVGGGVTNLQRWGSTSDGGNQASYRFRIDQSYKFIANNGSGDNLTIDSSNGSIIPSGGIYLGGTAAVHKLDYYEEGTFIPYLEFGGNRVGIVYGSTAGSTYQGGNYTRIGRVVTFSLRIILSSKGTSVGTATIVGLPYTVGGQPANYGSAMYSFANNFLIPERPTITIDTSSSIIRLRYVNSPSGGYANVTDSGFNNNSDIILTGTYQTS